MMKKYIASTLLASALLLACQNNTVPQHTEEGPQQLQINVALQNPTKAPVVGTAFDHGTKIKILLEDADGSGTNYNVAQVYQLDRQDPTAAGAWASVETSGLMVKRTEATVTAIYPHDAQLTDDFSTLKLEDTPELDLGERNVSSNHTFFPIALDPNKPTETTEVFVANAEKDYMLGAGNNVSIEVGKTKHTTITMTHIRAMVVVKLIKDDTYMGADELTAIKFSNNEKGNSSAIKIGYINMSTGSYVPNDPVEQTFYKRTMSKFPIGSTFALLANPTNALVGQIQLTITLGQTNHVFALPALNWTSGEVYLYTVRLTPSGVALDNQVTMLDWPSPLKYSFELN